MSVPATEHAFTEQPPDQLYIDTDFIIACLERTDPHHNRCAVFMERLVAHDRTTLFISSLSWLEMIHAITRQRFRDLVGDDLRRRFRLDRWDELTVRQSYTAYMVESFSTFLDQCDWAEVDLTPAIRAEAVGLISTYNLGTHDAVHLATAGSVGVVDFASLDRGYRRIDALHLWNDRIYE
jgi:predicted nucleic acid-binding protein